MPKIMLVLKLRCFLNFYLNYFNEKYLSIIKNQFETFKKIKTKVINLN